MIYTFGTYTLDPQTHELYDNRTLCKLEPRALAILTYLIEHRDHIVSHAELQENLWPGQSISEAVVHNGIKTARKAIGDSGDGQHTIRTIYGRGYRFVAQAREHSPTSAGRDGVPRDPVPLFTEPRRHGDAAAPSSEQASADPFSTSQNVLVGDYGFGTVVCGMLENLTAPRDGLAREVIPRLRQTVFALAQEEAARHGGTFTFFGSNGFLVVFGLPVVHVDHAKRAVLMGLRLQDRLHERCSILDPSLPVDVTVRMGMHTGPIEITSPSDPLGFTLLTPSATTALAVRLQYQAKAGHLLVSKATIAHVYELVTSVDHGAMPMPGHAQRLMAYRICGLAPLAADLSAAGLDRS